MATKFIYRNTGRVLAVDERAVESSTDCSELLRTMFQRQHQINRSLRVCIWTVGIALYAALVAAKTIFMAARR